MERNNSDIDLLKEIPSTLESFAKYAWTICLATTAHSISQINDYENIIPAIGYGLKHGLEICLFGAVSSLFPLVTSAALIEPPSYNIKKFSVVFGLATMYGIVGIDIYNGQKNKQTAHPQTTQFIDNQNLMTENLKPQTPVSDGIYIHEEWFGDISQTRQKTLSKFAF